MDEVININIPHVGEKIFQSFETNELVQCFAVSNTWKVLAENVLLKRWQGKFFEAWTSGQVEVVEILLDRSEIKDTDFNARDSLGMTIFMWACWDGHKDVVKGLLDHPASNSIDINGKDNFGWTAFSEACFC